MSGTGIQGLIMDMSETFSLTWVIPEVKMQSYFYIGFKNQVFPEMSDSAISQDKPIKTFTVVFSLVVPRDVSIFVCKMNQQQDSFKISV